MGLQAAYKATSDLSSMASKVEAVITFSGFQDCYGWSADSRAVSLEHKGAPNFPSGFEQGVPNPPKGLGR